MTSFCQHWNLAFRSTVTLATPEVMWIRSFGFIKSWPLSFALNILSAFCWIDDCCLNKGTQQLYWSLHLGSFYAHRHKLVCSHRWLGVSLHISNLFTSLLPYFRHLLDWPLPWVTKWVLHFVHVEPEHGTFGETTLVFWVFSSTFWFYLLENLIGSRSNWVLCQCGVTGVCETSSIHIFEIQKLYPFIN